MVILFDRFNLPTDVLDVIFATKQQKIVATELLKYVVKKGGSLGKADMSFFATQLHDGTYETTLEEEPYKKKKVRISYNRRQFYDRILTPMKSMGMIDYDLYKKIYSISEHFNEEMARIGEMWMSSVKALGEK
jgi:hypothetical protein